MSRGPGKVERVVENTLRDADRSFSVEELSVLAYPGINRAEKKHRVLVQHAVNNVANRMPVWSWWERGTGACYFHCNGSNVRSYVHGLLRVKRWRPERTLGELDDILRDTEIQTVMQPGGLWWTDIEIYKAEYERSWVKDTPELRRLIKALKLHRRGLFGYASHPEFEPIWDKFRHGWLPESHILLGRFEPPGTPVFEHSMKLRQAHPIEMPW
jgi:hypothetical protein